MDATMTTLTKKLIPYIYERVPFRQVQVDGTYSTTHVFAGSGRGMLWDIAGS